MPDGIARLPIWDIPQIAQLPTPAVETLQVLSDLVPFLSVPPRDAELADYEPGLRAWCLAEDAQRRVLDFQDWTAHAARLGLLHWSEREALVAQVRALMA